MGLLADCRYDAAMTFARLATVSLVYLIALLCFGWGFAAAQYKIFPWSYIQAVSRFVRGDANEETTVVQKAMNDLGVSPERLIRRFSPSNAAGFREVVLEGIRDRRDAPRLWMAPAAPVSYRVIVGGFDFEEAFWGAVLLDPSGRILRRWYMNGEIEGLSETRDELKSLFGVAFFPDGSAAFIIEEKPGGIVKIDACSRVEWTKKGLFHHVISPTEDSSAFWTFGGKHSDLHPELLLIDAASGETIKKIDMAAVEIANPETFIFDLRRQQRLKNATHPNDIKPLPAAVASAYPRFAAGDLVISYSTTNLIFVMDPETLAIKWWYVGAGDGQHDPDWHEDGTISIFNNNFRARQRDAALSSSIVSVDPRRNTHRTVVDGGRHDFYSKINGNHQFTDYGTVIVTSSTQGRVFEVDLSSGEIVFEFVNAYDWENGRTLHMVESFAVDQERIERWAPQDCAIEGAWKVD